MSITLAVVSAISSPALAASLCRAVHANTSQAAISKPYMQMATWINDLLRTSAMVEKNSALGLIDLGNSSKVSIAKSAEKKFGVVTNDQWVPKNDISDPQIQREIQDDLKDIFRDYISELKNVSSVQGEQAALQKVQKEIILTFEKKFGKIPRKLIVDSEFAIKLKEIGKPAPKIEYPRLNSRQLALLKNHPLAKWAESFDGGAGLAFSSVHFNAETNSNGLYKGERSQALFVQKILRELFPKAGFVDHGINPVPNKQRVHIVIADLAERFSGEGHRIAELEGKGAVLPMNLGKAANVREGRKNKIEVRQQLGLPAGRKIVHIYVRSEDTMTNHRGSSQFSALFAAMEKFSPLDIVIVTFGNHAEGFSFENSGITTSARWNSQTNVSSLKAGVNLPERTVIFNDTVGKVVDLHNAADYSVIVGPVNFFEPLNVGTPTLLIAKTHAEERDSDYKSYDKEALSNYAKFAERSGIFRSLEISRSNNDYTPVTSLLKELSRARESSTLLSDTAFTLYLDAIQKHLDYQMNRFDKSDYQGLNFP